MKSCRARPPLPARATQIRGAILPRPKLASGRYFHAIRFVYEFAMRAIQARSGEFS